MKWLDSISAALLRARTSQCFQCPYSPEPRQHCSIFLAKTSQAVPLSAKSRPPHKRPVISRTSLGLLASRLFSFLFVPGPSWGTALFMNHHNLIEVGKYQVSPLATQLDDGGFSASVSIRSGKGSATHDRVSRFTRLFDNAPAALHYATEHALAWIGERNTQNTRALA